MASLRLSGRRGVWKMRTPLPFTTARRTGLSGLAFFKETLPSAPEILFESIRY